MGPNGHRARLICITTPQPLRVKAPVRSPGTTTFGVVVHLPPIPGVTPQTAQPRALGLNPFGVPGRGTIVRRFPPLNHQP